MNNWRKCFAVLALVVSLSACQSVLPNRQLDFQVDGGAVKSFQMTERGALPASDGTYHVENLGLMLYQADNGQLEYAWNFVVNVEKKAPSHIQVSQVLNDGTAQALITDEFLSDKRGDAWRNLDDGSRSQVLAQRWHAVSKGKNMAQVAWLNQPETETMFVFKIEIQAQDGSRSVLYQPMVLAPDSKQQYLKLMAQIPS
ncbi:MULTISPECIES: hypothetical protein [Vitreoscilla]|uniref:Lipoprotein n=1 Tax=Vitreoscilla stercoraria TaxID=61 RepID=A0ABY4E9P3_VITST|nr:MULTISPECIES: hypothetical protein [Vitreoscilla]AUZ04211.1 hypothetical protein ADP71_04140 [Vitreoscilla sp. C1]UOO92031.1 hypothetical protein LVJ81_10415 [Vitreoscilla stercoraria]